MQDSMEELVRMIDATESIEEEGKKWWKSILPYMTDEQVDRLFDILETERRKLEELERKYQQEIKSINEKHLIEWQEFTRPKHSPTVTPN